MGYLGAWLVILLGGAYRAEQQRRTKRRGH